MRFTGFFHEAKSNYSYAADKHTLHIRLRTGQGEAKNVQLAIFDPYNWVRAKDRPNEYVFDIESCVFAPMDNDYSSRGYDYWFAEANVPTKRAKYAFIAESADECDDGCIDECKNVCESECEDGCGEDVCEDICSDVCGSKTESYFYGPAGAIPYKGKSHIGELTESCYAFPYISEEDVFRPPQWVDDICWYQIFPERFANSGSGSLRKGELLPWGSQPDVSNKHLFGGDLQGIIDKLDYIKNMGFSGIYLTPVFTSPSTHKYNTEDYFQIDPAFGDHAIFGRLMEEAKKRGIRIMLDLVFNHAGNTHPFWKDVLINGKASRYYDCFCISGVKDGKPVYETFGTTSTMPRWNVSNPFARAYLLDVAVYWARTYGIDSFRLDVANEVSHAFWREFRKTVHDINPELYIVGEVWDTAMPWLQGDQFDSVMNYPLAVAIWDFVSGKEDSSGLTGGTRLKDSISSYLAYYPKNRQQAMFNLIGTHDTGRILSTSRNRVERVMQAFGLLFTFAGSPCVFYGDEIGLSGGEKYMEGSRQCMQWDESKQNLTIKELVKKLISLRAAYPSFKTCDVKWICADERYAVYVKQAPGETTIVMLNAADDDIEITLPGTWAGLEAKDLLNDQDVIIQNTAALTPYGLKILHTRQAIKS